MKKTKPKKDSTPKKIIKDLGVKDAARVRGGVTSGPVVDGESSDSKHKEVIH